MNIIEPKSNLSVSVVVPVYNSETSLDLLVDCLRIVLNTFTTTFEIILVNDGSADRSWQVINELTCKYSFVHGINLLRNYGQHNALLCGIRAASNEIIVTMDDDLQHPPEELPKLFDKLYEGYDVIYGTPINEQHDLWRSLASQVTKLVLQSAMGTQSARDSGAFRVFRTQLRDAFAEYRSPYVSIDVLLTWGTKRFASVPVHHDARLVGKSHYTFRMLITHALNMMTGFSILPLELASLVGFGFTVFGLIVLLYVVGRYLIQGGVVPGFAFLASTIAIFSGAQLFALGIIGEYLARMHFRSMERPAYTVESAIFGNHNANKCLEKKDVKVKFPS